MQAVLAWGLLSSWGWRWLLGLSSLPLLVLLVAYPWLPESPYWLAVQVGAGLVLQDLQPVVNEFAGGRQGRFPAGRGQASHSRVCSCICHPVHAAQLQKLGHALGPCMLTWPYG